MCMCTCATRVAHGGHWTPGEGTAGGYESPDVSAEDETHVFSKSCGFV